MSSFLVACTFFCLYSDAVSFERLTFRYRLFLEGTADAMLRSSSSSPTSSLSSGFFRAWKTASVLRRLVPESPEGGGCREGPLVPRDFLDCPDLLVYSLVFLRIYVCF